VGGGAGHQLHFAEQCSRAHAPAVCSNPQLRDDQQVALMEVEDYRKRIASPGPLPDTSDGSAHAEDDASEWGTRGWCRHFPQSFVGCDPSCEEYAISVHQ
jgi:hypothetical protein